MIIVKVIVTMQKKRTTEPMVQRAIDRIFLVELSVPVKARHGR
jgi:hypothetical protein